MKNGLAVFFCVMISFLSVGQGVNNNWLLGYNNNVGDTFTAAGKARIDFSSGSPDTMSDFRKMKFLETEGNISDANGNLLMSSNGIWIADATGDTMMNGSGLNPGPIVNSWSNYGLPMPNSNLILPFPADTTKFILFHMVANQSVTNRATELFYSFVDISANGGLGMVTSKNQIALQDTLTWGIGACKHANGRDWWVIVLKDSSDVIFKLLLTPSGITSITSQSMGFPLNAWGNVTQPVFSPDGTKFAYTAGHYFSGNYHVQTHIFNFNRCTGSFSDYVSVNNYDNLPGEGIAFSPNSRYLYTCTTNHIFQVNTDTSNISASLDTVATNDGFYSPAPPFQDNFELMYLAQDGRIYITSWNSTIDLHYISAPDSGRMNCNVQQHALRIPCYNTATVPNHPNYFLGCDTSLGCLCLLTTNIESQTHNFLFSIYPNPVANQQLKISYLLRQNMKGVFEIFDVTGRKVFSYALPQWSTMQHFSLPELGDGIYQCFISSGNERVGRKMAVVNGGF